MHTALINFQDIDGTTYKAGDTYPRECLTEKRIRQLSTGDNRTGKPVIEPPNGNHLPDLDHMGIDELRQFAHEHNIMLPDTITNPDTARRRIAEALGGE